jgi:hypothetical protein
LQTFLINADFYESAKCLDYRRLGKQRVECKQILNALLGRSKGWRNHPATSMWRGYEQALCKYGAVICDEWIRRGYKDSLFPFFMDLWAELGDEDYPENPPWLGNEDFHAAHKSVLLRKDPEYYGQFNWSVPNNLEYIWPV